MQRKIILGSGSPRRKEILVLTGLSFDVQTSDYEEELDKDLPPSELVAYLGQKKAEDVARHFDDAIVIGSDTMCEYRGKMLGKPHTDDRAREMLKILAGEQHRVLTGYTIIDTQNQEMITRTIETKVTFREISDEEIDTYVKTGESLDKAGAYGMQGKGALLVKKIEGDYFNIIGLPISSLWQDLQKML